MNARFLFESLTEMLHRGVDYVAAFAFGVVAVSLIWWPIARRRKSRSLLLDHDNTELRDRNAELSVQVGRLHERLTEAERNLNESRGETTVQQRRVEERGDICNVISSQLIHARDQLSQSESDRRQLEGQLAEVESALAGQKEELDDLSAQLETLTSFDGRIWMKPAQAAPAFRDLTPQRPPIIAVVNLKGGVGKTTVTANLGCTLWNDGRKVLLIDLDFQASLTQLCLTGARHAAVRESNRQVQRLLTTAAPDGRVVAELAEPIGDTSGRIVAAFEDLADVEQQVMAEWTANRTGDDVRFRLRNALHADEVQSRYDAILLDCPPRLSTACVNALAASDYVLVPVIADHLSAEAVPRLIRWLRKFQHEAGVCPQLGLLGIVGNRAANRHGFNARQQDVWNGLEHKCLDNWGEPVHRFEATLPETVEFHRAMSERRFAADGALAAKFKDLAAEIRNRMPRHESRATGVVS